MKKKSKLARIDPLFEEKLMGFMKDRYKKGLCDVKEVNMREATHLATKTLSINMLGEELRVKPKRRKK